MAITTAKNIGDEIDSRWKITETLTSDSGQGHTYKVQDLSDESQKTEYVIKFLNKINEKTLARFKREIKASITLEHPNIVRAVDSKYEATSEPYLVMHLCSGGELDKKKIEKLPLIRKLKMFELICEGIAYAHENKVIHRDIKPRNIFLVDQQSKTPIVGDFGICFFDEDDEDDERLTAIREPVGAKSFRPPEAEFGIVENVAPSFDVYSLGKLLYWFLSNGDILVREHYAHQKFDLRIQNSEQAIYFAYEIFDKSIREDINERYKNAVEMLEKVKELVKFVENDARYLDYDVPQKCIFCRSGKYVFVKSPSLQNGFADYTVSSKNGFQFTEHNGVSFQGKPLPDYAPRVLIATCDNCGNVQLFRLDKNTEPLSNWKNVPKAK